MESHVRQVETVSVTVDNSSGTIYSAIDGLDGQNILLSEGTTLRGDHLTKLIARITLSASTALTRKIKLSQVHNYVSKFEDITFEGCLKSRVAMATSATPLCLPC